VNGQPEGDPDFTTVAALLMLWAAAFAAMAAVAVAGWAVWRWAIGGGG
jgi:hypothetical protein